MFMLAITLSRCDFREADQRIILYTLTRGKIELVARGVKKNIAKNAPALEPFSLIDIEIAPGRELTYLTKAYIIEQFINIRTHLTNMFVGAAALKLVERLVKVGEKDTVIFHLLVSFLQFLNSTDNISPILLSGFTIQLLRSLGFVPVLDRCVRCSKKIEQLSAYVFAVNHGGLECGGCRSVEVNDTLLPLSASAVEILLQLQQATWLQINSVSFDPQAQKMAEKIVNNFTLYHTNYPVTNWQGNEVFAQ